MENPKQKIRITFNGQPYRAERGQTALEALINNGLLLRSDCGGKGRCGKCQVKIQDPDKNRGNPD